jgi:hypothetical protein
MDQPEPREIRKIVEMECFCTPEERAAERPSGALQMARHQLCELKHLRRVLDEGRAKVARGKGILNQLHDDSEALVDDDSEMTILEWLLNAGARWINRGMDRIDPLMTAAQRQRFGQALEECNQTIDETLDAFYESVTCRRSGHLVQDLQFEVARELSALRKDNIRVLAILRRP